MNLSCSKSIIWYDRTCNYLNIIVYESDFFKLISSWFTSNTSNHAKKSRLHTNAKIEFFYDPFSQGKLYLLIL